jgi:hypothetical protein
MRKTSPASWPATRICSISSAVLSMMPILSRKVAAPVFRFVRQNLNIEVLIVQKVIVHCSKPDGTSGQTFCL